MADNVDNIDYYFGYLRVCLSENQHDEICWKKLLNCLEKLKLWSKLKANRSKMSKETFDLLNKLTENCLKQLVLSSETSDDGLWLRVLTETFRVLRNCCAENEQNQELLMKMGIIDQIKENLSLLLKPKFQESKDCQLVNTAIKSGIQLLGNIVVGNKITQGHVWQKCFPSFFLCVLSCGDCVCKECLCMVIYNCLNTQHRADSVSAPEGCQIVAEILHLVSEQKEFEWGFFVLNALLFSHLTEMYIGLHFDPSSRIILLDLVNAKLSEVTSDSSSSCRASSFASSGFVQESALLFLAEQFISNGQTAVLEMRKQQPGEDILDAFVLSRLLTVLCSASALHDCYLELVNCTKLLQTALDMLREINKAEYKDTFSNQSKIPTCEDSGDLSPSHGFKRDLVQLLGNMCFENRANQDKIRELDGLPVILDNCNIDDHNPYICQWAIFAIRNLLNNNLENQAVVAAMKRRGLADSSKLRQFGVDVVEQNGKIKIVPIK